MKNITPELRVDSDYDGYFENLVGSWIEAKRIAGESFNHTAIKITAGPYRSSAVTTHELEDNVLHLDFYSALRAGFGALSSRDIRAIMEML